MDIGIYDTAVLNGVVQSLRRTPTFILDTVFPDVMTEESEDIHFDVIDDKPRIAPFVSPLLEGKVVQSKGFKTHTFRPAYIKDKRIHNPEKALKRRAGERLTGGMTNEQRWQANIMSDLMDQEEMLTRRWELMGIDALLDGKTTVDGDGFDAMVVDFQRDPALTIQLAGAAQWGETGVQPLDNIEVWMEQVLQVAGAGITQIVMDPKAWRLFRDDPDARDALDTRRGSRSTAEIGPQVPIEGVQRKGDFGEITFSVYGGYYQDPATGALAPYLPANTVLGLSPQVEGVRQFGAIIDEAAGLQAREMFAKSWAQQDPSVRYLLMQSAPLMVPYRPNASFCASVRA